MDPLHTLTLGDVLREHRRSYPRQTALVCQDARFTYPEMDDRVNRLANGLTGAGLRSGDRILWLGQNCHRVLEGLLAAAKTGGVFCPVNWRQSAQELAFVLEDVEPTVVVWQEEEIGDAVRQAREQTRSPALWLQHDGE
ncbi:MAG TPA: AMP-binding protein, partial [Acidimicrobiales bacterium]|nr:AMP-binding protein [Acidimicrobiales bacterium]